MSEEYLWDKTGEPDRDVADLEMLLGQLQFRQGRQPVRQPTRRANPAALWLAAAAVVTAGVVIPLSQRGAQTDWRYSARGLEARTLRTGQVIDTGGVSDARLESSFTGALQIESRSRLRLVASADKQQRFRLERGTIHAVIWAAPGKFVVDTPGARTVDLGCRYTLHMDEDGTGFLRVETGWVAFEWKGTESFIPAGAACQTKPQRGPGTPYFADASDALRAALERFDAAPGRATMAAALPLVRKKDAMTVWHLMTRVKSWERTEAYDRLASLVVLPAAASKDSIVRGETAAVDAAWNALDLGSAEVWRNWKRGW
ncbi:MAG: hypothetical protein JWN34_5410 [Bryobacterales bacterium]|nr:hypothetical protein [Bryobacterales bacterium]